MNDEEEEEDKKQKLPVKKASLEELQITNEIIHHLSASKIADQFWCETQLFFKTLYGAEPTEQMIQGTKIHRELEEELGPIIEIKVTTEEEAIFSFLLQMYTKLALLKNEGITRELPVFGKIGSFYCLGIIDQVEIITEKNNQQLRISDYKTRFSNRPPSFIQQRRNRIQMQIYRYLLGELRKGKICIPMFEDFFGKEFKNLEVTEAFIEQIPKLYHNLLENTNPKDLLEGILSEYHSLPKVDNELQAIYLHHETKEVIFIDRSIFHDIQFEVDMEWALEFWLGNRKAKNSSQKWMCNYCPFTEACPYFRKEND
jgi:hypothetical protein